MADGIGCSYSLWVKILHINSYLHQMTKDGSEVYVHIGLSDCFMVFYTGGVNYVRNSNWNTVTLHPLNVLLSHRNLSQKIHKKVHFTIVIRTYLWSSSKFALIIRHQGAANVSRNGSPASLWIQNDSLASEWNRNYCSPEQSFWHFRSLGAFKAVSAKTAKCLHHCFTPKECSTKCRKQDSEVRNTKQNLNGYI
jgi:hypothetical protein